jgi:hypothetical protein
MAQTGRNDLRRSMIFYHSAIDRCFLAKLRRRSCSWLGRYKSPNLKQSKNYLSYFQKQMRMVIQKRYFLEHRRVNFLSHLNNFSNLNIICQVFCCLSYPPNKNGRFRRYYCKLEKIRISEILQAGDLT